jgi:hypothetical protein
MAYELQYGGRIDGYRIRYARSSSSSYSSFYISTTSYSYGRTVSGLTPYTRYKFSVAVDLERYSSYNYGSSTYCTTNQAAPGPVISLRTTTVSSTCITVTWSSPSYPNGVIDRYYWYATSVTSGISHSPNGYVSSSRRSVTICYLHEGTRYRITVYARNGAGTGSRSSIYRTTTTIAPSGPPLSVVAQEGSSLDITLRWQRPSILLRNGDITRYTIYWNGGNSVPTTETQHRFTTLAPYTTYYFQVAAENSAGRGPRSSSVSERTRQTGKLIMMYHCDVSIPLSTILCSHYNNLYFVFTML